MYVFENHQSLMLEIRAITTGLTLYDSTTPGASTAH